MDHWAALRAGITMRGLGHLVAGTAEEAHANVVVELGGEGIPGAHDPLMSANFAIFSRALKVGGMYLLTREYCPLCELDLHTVPPPGAPVASTIWIESCLDAELMFCRTKGLVPNTSQ